MSGIEPLSPCSSDTRSTSELQKAIGTRYESIITSFEHLALISLSLLMQFLRGYYSGFPPLIHSSIFNQH
jgi:hypothetical protein